MSNRTITAKELAARWCYSELSSDRMSGWYPDKIFLDLPGLADLKYKSTSGITFDNLCTNERDLLETAHKHPNSNRVHFNSDINAFAEYIETELSLADLGSIYFVSHYWQSPNSPTKVCEYVNILSDPKGQQLREQLKKVQHKNFVQHENVIVLPIKIPTADPRHQFFCNILIEGTFRECWFQQDGKSHSLRCWIPKRYLPPC